MSWETYKFRCSALGNLMTEPREKSPLVKHGEAVEKLKEYKEKYAETKNKETKTAQALLEKIATQEENVRVLAEVKDQPHLSETVKTYLKELWIAETYGREKDIMNKYMKKGLLAEEDSITLLTNVLGRFFIKNEERFENEYIKGTPDIIDAESIIDIKTSWDLWTFGKAEVTKNYYWQLMGYMWLTGKKRAYLDYCLVDAPYELIQDELRKLSWKMMMIDTQDPLYLEAEEKIEHAMTFGDIPPNIRVKTFHVDFSYNDIEALKKRIEECRNYLSNLTL